MEWKTASGEYISNVVGEHVFPYLNTGNRLSWKRVEINIDVERCFGGVRWYRASLTFFILLLKAHVHVSVVVQYIFKYFDTSQNEKSDKRCSLADTEQIRFRHHELATGRSETLSWLPCGFTVVIWTGFRTINETLTRHRFNVGPAPQTPVWELPLNLVKVNNHW